MENTSEILTELREITPFLGKTGLSRIPYAVPYGYFEEFSEILMNRIRMGDSEISPKDEINGLSPLLAGLRQKNPYRVPGGYFDSENIHIPSSKDSSANLYAINSGSSKKDDFQYRHGSIPPKSKKISNYYKVLGYAVAACLVGFLGITLFNLSDHSVQDPLHALTTVSDQDMANYLDNGDVHWTPGLTPETASVEFTDADIHALFSNVSDEELEQYHPVLPLEKGTVN
jgi:hypothetical protein